MTENSLIGYALAWGVCSAATAVAMRWAIVQAGNQATRDALWQRKRTKYLFNKDTGEWRKILTKGSNGRVNVDSRSRRERLTEETKEFESAQKGAIKGPFFLWAGIGAVAYIGLQGTSGLVEKCFQIAVISIALLRSSQRMLSELR